MIDYDRLKARVFSPVIQTYSRRDSALYALGLNIGADPLDPRALRHVAFDPPETVSTMAMTLARLGSWMREPDTGIDYRKIMVGEIALRVHARLPPEARVRGEHRVTRITDKGEGRGALVTVVRDLYDDETGRLLAEYEQVTFCRANGGFAKDGRHDPPAANALPFEPWQDRSPDIVLDIPTLPQQALIYRLSGDLNPLHFDPETARRAGFDRPILHGLATMGMAGYALVGATGQSLRSIRGRLSAPVFPGATLQLQGWKAPDCVVFRILDEAAREVLSNGIFYHIMD